MDRVLVGNGWIRCLVCRVPTEPRAKKEAGYTSTPSTITTVPEVTAEGEWAERLGAFEGFSWKFVLLFS
jgi:hypothetical protein